MASISDGNVTALDLYYDKMRDQQTLYVVLNRSETNILALVI